MPFEIGDDIVNNNDQTYLVEKVEVIRLPPDSLGGQGDIALQRKIEKANVTIEKVEEGTPEAAALEAAVAEQTNTVVEPSA